MKFFFHIVKTTIFLSMLFTFVGCGDEGAGDFPYEITAHNSTIDWGNVSEDGRSLIAATMFDDKGNPLDEGNMIFTLNASARGSLSDGDELVRSVSVDLDDGVAEVWFIATHTPEVVTITAYGPRFPNDTSVSTSVRVFNSALVVNKAEFRATVDEDSSNVVSFYDLSEYPEGTNPGIGNDVGDITWTYTFIEFTSDGATPPGYTPSAPIIRTGSRFDDRDVRPVFDANAAYVTASLDMTIGGVTVTSNPLIQISLE